MLAQQFFLLIHGVIIYQAAFARIARPHYNSPTTQPTGPPSIIVYANPSVKKLAPVNFFQNAHVAAIAEVETELGSASKTPSHKPSTSPHFKPSTKTTSKPTQMHSPTSTLPSKFPSEIPPTLNCEESAFMMRYGFACSIICAATAKTTKVR